MIADAGRGVPGAEMAVLRAAAPVGFTDGDTVSVDVHGRALDCEVVSRRSSTSRPVSR